MADTRVFLSHTKFDEDFCNKFDNICSNVGMKRFRSEFAQIDSPPWRTIKEQLAKSEALFLLVGKELVNRQASQYHHDDWKFTQNWISYEIGIAHQRNIDIWIVCDAVQINFPVPYFNNYMPFVLDPRDPEYMNAVLENYLHGRNFHISSDVNSITEQCPNCSIQFNLHANFEAGTMIICPHCLHGIQFQTSFSSTVY